MPGIDPPQVRAQLAAILQHPLFVNAESVARFLRFVVEETLEGRGRDLKEYRIGVEVLGRGEAFDPRIDTIVRVEARRLRAKLKSYYDAQPDARVIITIPKGTYTPEFTVVAVRPAAIRSKRWVFAAISGVLLVATGTSLLIRGRRTPTPGTTVAVLPIEGGSDEYVGHAITEEIARSLSRVPGIRIVTPSRGARFRSAAADFRGLAAELGVDSILSGRIDAHESSVLVSARLTNSLGGVTWSNEWEAPRNGSFGLQQKIATAVVQALRLRSAVPKTSDDACEDGSGAYDLYMRGLYYARKRTTGDLARSLDLLQRAAERNPRCSRFLGALAEAYVLQGLYGLMAPAEAHQRVEETANTALALNPSSGVTHMALGASAVLFAWNWPAAEESFRAALASEPQLADAHHWYAAFVLAPQGRTDEALSYIRRARQIDPYSLTYASTEITTLYFAGRYDEGIDRARHAIELDPSYFQSYLYLAWCYEQKRMFPEALTALNTAQRLSEGGVLIDGEQAVVYALMGRRADAEHVVATLEARGKSTYVPPAIIGHVYAVLGDADTAFQWIDRARAEHSPLLIYANIAHDFDSIRRDPRFGLLLREVGLQH